MRVLIDANILLDVMERREPHYDSSSLVWKLCEVGAVEGYFSALTYANLIYIMRKELSPADIQEIWEKLCLIFYIADLTEEDIERAASEQWEDFEDAVQSVTAERIGANFIVTRNLKDYRGSKIKAVTPSKFVEIYGGRNQEVIQ